MNDNQIIDGALNYLADFVKNYSAMAGTIKMFAGSVAPDGWLLCNGQAVSRTTYSKLFNVIGTTYGEGDGSTTFNVPDLRGRTPVGVGTGTATNATAHTLGQKAGAESSSYTPDGTIGGTAITPSGTIGGTAITKAQLPSLTGSIRIRNTSNSSYDMITSASGIVAVEDYGSATGSVGYSTGTNKLQQLTISFGSGSTHTHTWTGSSSTHTHSWTGTAATINKMQPYLAVNYIICTGDDLDLNPSTNPEFRSGSGTVTVPVAASGSNLTLLATLPAGLWEVKLRCTWPTSAGTINKNFGINRKGINGAGFFAAPSGASTGYTADTISRIVKIDPNQSAEDRNIYLYAWQGGNSEVELDYSYQIVQLGGVVDRDYDYPIGERRQTSGSLSSLASTSLTKVKVDTLPNGIWLISSRVEYAANATGERSLSIYTNDSVGAGYIRRTASQGSTATTVLTAHKVVEINDNTINRDVQLGFWQSSGSALNVNSYHYYATQIGGNIETQYINGAVFENKTITSETINIAANNSSWAEVDAPENAIAVTGYYLTGTNNTSTLVYAMYFNPQENIARFALKNTASSQAALNAQIQFLCVTNTQPVFVDNTYSDKVDALERVITGTFTPVSGVTATEIQVKQVGKTVMIKGYVTKSGNFTSGSNVKIGDISGVDFPTSHIRTVCGAGAQAYNATDSGYMIIGSNGQISIQLATARANVIFCVTYLAVE